MIRITKWLLVLIVLSSFAHPASAVNTPIWPNNCANASSNFNSLVSTISCNLNSVVSGNTVVIITYTQSLTTHTVTVSGGETVTCPAGAVGTSGQEVTQICYVVLGASHATFTVTVSTTGGVNQAHSIVASEVQGLGSVDAGSAAGAAGSTVSTTTAGTNEIIFEACAAYSNDLAPDAAYHQIGFNSVIGTNNQDYKTLTSYHLAPTATTISSTCTQTNLFAASDVIATLAFSISGAPAPPAIGLVQFCHQNGPPVNVAQTCSLHGTTSGNKIVVGTSQLTASTVITCAGTETCTCPAGATTPTIVYGGFSVELGICYADTTIAHTKFDVDMSNIAAGGDMVSIWAQEVSGLNTGVDSGSAAAATAITVNYTTAVANEWTFCYAGDDLTNPMVAGSSFIAIGQSTGITGTGGPIVQSLAMAKRSVSSGSNTCSYSPSNAEPVIATLSFGVTSSSGVPRKHGIIL